MKNNILAAILTFILFCIFTYTSMLHAPADVPASRTQQELLDAMGSVDVESIIFK